MAVYQAARRESVVLGRRPLSAPARARYRSHPIGRILALILTVLMVGLIYLTQSIQLAATAYEIDRLAREHEQLMRELQSLEGTIMRWGAEPMLVGWGQQEGLDRIAGKVRIPAR